VLKNVAGTRSVYAERTAGGYFLDFALKRDAIARYGLTVGDVEMHVMSAVGGENITTTVEGRERYPVNVRYLRDFRSSLDRLGRVLVATENGAQVPMAQLADIQVLSGPSMIRDENGLLSGYVYVDVAGRDIGGYVAEAKATLRQELDLPPGYRLTWSGQYEYMERVAERLLTVVPLTIFVIFVLLYVNTGSVVKSFIIFLAVPFSAVGAIWLLYLLDYHVSIGVWVGLIALMGMDAETGVFMLLYLDLAYQLPRLTQEVAAAAERGRRRPRRASASSATAACSRLPKPSTGRGSCGPTPAPLPCRGSWCSRLANWRRRATPCWLTCASCSVATPSAPAST
jgi:Cu(I)/Ag(I) efflux system membrane protein CusA/SilA